MCSFSDTDIDSKCLTSLWRWRFSCCKRSYSSLRENESSRQSELCLADDEILLRVKKVFPLTKNESYPRHYIWINPAMFLTKSRERKRELQSAFVLLIWSWLSLLKKRCNYSIDFFRSFEKRSRTSTNKFSFHFPFLIFDSPSLFPIPLSPFFIPYSPFPIHHSQFFR